MGKRGSERLTWGRVGWGLLGLLLFIAALILMKEGARGLQPLLQEHLEITNSADSLGFGWLMSYLVLSGSPVAAMAVALQSAGSLQPAQTFTMITGSRLGASSFVLLLGFIYALRQKERWTALTAGLLSFLIVGSAQLLALPVGLWLLNRDWVAHLSLSSLEGLAFAFGRGIEPLVSRLGVLMPDWTLFVVGVGLVTLSFRFLDRAVPAVHLERTGFGQIPRLVYRPGVMFLMGLLVTVVTMSVSISVGILVPLSARGYVRRENIIPYILGANISTLVDTLAACVFLGAPQTLSVVVVHMAATTLVSLPVVLIAYRPYERAISNVLAWVTSGRAHLALFLGVVFVVPLVLVLL